MCLFPAIHSLSAAVKTHTHGGGLFKTFLILLNTANSASKDKMSETSGHFKYTGFPPKSNVLPKTYRTQVRYWDSAS